jgi:hypothetical protein
VCYHSFFTERNRKEKEKENVYKREERRRKGKRSEEQNHENWKQAVGLDLVGRKSVARMRGW